MGSISKNIGKAVLQGVNSNVVSLEAKQHGEAIAKEILERSSGGGGGKFGGIVRMYTEATNIIGGLVEGFEGLPEFSAVAKKIAEGEDLYMPGYPPMSPVSESYYSQWLLYDRRFGRDKETLVGMVLDCMDTIGIDMDTTVMKHMAESRMCVCEVLEARKDTVLLKELVSEEEFWAVCYSGYEGFAGQLWYVRRIPPMGEYKKYCDHSMITTTPYVLLNNKEDWLGFFKERGISKKTLCDFMKHGPDEYFWNEFVFYGFCQFVDKAIFLSGIPGKTETLPASDDYRDTGELGIRLGLEYGRSKGTSHWLVKGHSSGVFG